MKSLLVIAVLALSFNALAQESLGLSECSKGNDDGRSVVKTSSSQDASGSVSTSTSND